MKRLLGLVAGLILLSAPVRALDDTCTFPAEAQEWSLVCTTSGTAPTCTGVSNACDANDTFVIPSGATVTITGPITQNDVSDIGITVEDGGELIAEIDGTTVTSKISITLGGLGLLVEDGGKFKAQGAYRTAPGSGATAGLLDEPSTDNFFQVGDIQAVAGDATLLRWSYEPYGSQWDKWDNTSVAAQIPNIDLATHLNAIEAGDVVWLWDPVGGDTSVGHDTGYPYYVDNDPEAGDKGIEIQVRQGADDSPGYPLALRDIVTGTTQSAAYRGNRLVTLDTGAFAADRELIGRWIRFDNYPADMTTGVAAAACTTERGVYCEINDAVDSTDCGGGGASTNVCVYEGDTNGLVDAPLVWQEQSYKIQDTTDASPDTALLVSTRGLATDVRSGANYMIDYGQTTGSPFLVIVPIELLCAGGNHDSADDCDIDIQGSVHMEGLIFGAGTKLLFEPTADLYDDQQVKFIWGIDQPVVDPTDRIAIYGQDDEDWLFEWIALTGGSASAPGSNNAGHGFVIGCSERRVKLRYYFARHLSDDFMVGGDTIATYCSGATPGDTVWDVKYGQAAFGRTDVTSGDLIDLYSGGANEGSSFDNLVADAFPNDNTNSNTILASINSSLGTPWPVVSNLVVLGNQGIFTRDVGLAGSGSGADANDSRSHRWDVRDLLIINQSPEIGTDNSRRQFPFKVTRFIMRESKITGQNLARCLESVGSERCKAVYTDVAFDWSYGAFLNVDFDESTSDVAFLESDDSATINLNEVAILNIGVDSSITTNGGCTACYFIKNDSADVVMTIRNTIMGYTPGNFAHMTVGTTAWDTANITFGGVFFAGMREVNAAGTATNILSGANGSVENIQYTGDMCWWDFDRDVSSADYFADLTSNGVGFSTSKPPIFEGWEGSQIMPKQPSESPTAQCGPTTVLGPSSQSWAMTKSGIRVQDERVGQSAGVGGHVPPFGF